MRWEIGDGNPNSLLHLRAVNLCVGGVFMKPPELVPIFLGTFFAMNPSWVLDERIWDWKFGVFLLWFSNFFFGGFRVGCVFISGLSRILGNLRFFMIGELLSLFFLVVKLWVFYFSLLGNSVLDCVILLTFEISAERSFF